MHDQYSGLQLLEVLFVGMYGLEYKRKRNNVDTANTTTICKPKPIGSLEVLLRAYQSSTLQAPDHAMQLHSTAALPYTTIHSAPVVMAHILFEVVRLHHHVLLLTNIA
jgi:hypothetical protein